MFGKNLLKYGIYGKFSGKYWTEYENYKKYGRYVKYRTGGRLKSSADKAWYLST